MFDSPLIVKFSWIKVTWEILSCNIYIYMYELLLVAISIIEQFERDDRNRREGAIVAKIFQSLFEIRLNHRGWERREREERVGGAAKRKRRSNGNEREQFSRPRRDSYFHLCACVRARTRHGPMTSIHFHARMENSGAGERGMETEGRGRKLTRDKRYFSRRGVKESSLRASFRTNL